MDASLPGIPLVKVDFGAPIRCKPGVFESQRGCEGQNIAAHFRPAIMPEGVSNEPEIMTPAFRGRIALTQMVDGIRWAITESEKIAIFNSAFIPVTPNAVHFRLGFRGWWNVFRLCLETKRCRN